MFSKFQLNYKRMRFAQLIYLNNSHFPANEHYSEIILCGHYVTFFGFGDNIFSVHTIVILYPIVYIHISLTYSYTVSVNVKHLYKFDTYTVSYTVYSLIQRVKNIFENSTKKFRTVALSIFSRIETLWIEKSWKSQEPWATREIIVNCALIRNNSF